MARREITIDMPVRGISPAIAAAMSGPVPQVMLAAWRQLAAEHADTGAYLASLTLNDTLDYPFMGDPLTVALISSAPHADWLEDGRAGFHLAAVWKSWKIGKTGNLYARVPFRVQTPMVPGGGASTRRRRLGAPMPAAVHARAMGLGDYWQTRERLTGFGDTYKQGKSYGYYGATFGEMPSSLGGIEGYEWKASQFEGLFRSTMPTPQGGRHTEYMTIRTITPDSPGWFIPPTPPLRIADRALDLALPAVREVIEAAAAQDAVSAIVQVTEVLQ